MASGTLLAVDVGKSRIGVARSDALGMFAHPVTTVARVFETLSQPLNYAEDTEKQLGAAVKKAAIDTPDLGEIVELAQEFSAQEIIVGLPLNLEGERTPATDDAEYFALAIARSLQEQNLRITVRLVDERLTTRQAQAQLHAVGKTVKGSKKVIDQIAATMILQQILDHISLGGAVTGKVVTIE